ncbi:MAG: HAMP domain-containing protein, partial [Rhodobacteraceae bacterium]|nr:HAMP domain-containing protein [Paracoccaceae bacterium]
MKIAHKLPLFVVAFGAFMAAVIVTISTVTARNSAAHQAEEHFESLVAGRETAVEALMRGIEADLLTLAAMPSTETALQRLSGAWTNLGDEAANTVRDAYIANNPNPLGERHLLDRAKATIPYNIHHAKFHPAFRTLLTAKGYYDAFLVNLTGNIIYTVYKEDDYATNLFDGPYKDSGIGDLYRRIVEAEPGQVLFSDFAPYAPSGNAPAAFVGTQLASNSGQMVGVLILQIPVGMINAFMNDSRGVGETVEAYLVGPDMLMRSSSRFEGGYQTLDPVPEQEHITAALNGVSAFYPSVKGHDGQNVAAFSEPFQMMDTDMAIVIEQDRAELMAPVNNAMTVLLLISVACAAGLSVLGWLFARTITRPLDRISVSMESVASGNLSTEVTEAKRSDEIGKIGKTLVSMQEDLRHARSAQEERAEQQQEQQRVVEQLSSGLLRLAQGDFSQTITEPFSGEHEQLRADFNKTVENLSATVSQVVDSAQSIRNGAAEISQSSDDLSHRTESQAAT